MSATDRQRVEKIAGSRRARLTPAPGSSAEPVPGDAVDDDTTATDGDGADPRGGRRRSGPNDEQLRRDKPPHY